jgi:hypothetical protein
VNHDGENVDRPDVSAQSECEPLQQGNQAYAGNNHHVEDVGLSTKRFSRGPKPYE